MNKLIKQTFKLSLLALLGLALTGAVLVAAGRRDRIISAEVAVVLGNQVYRDGTPAPRLAARLDKSLELYRSGLVKRIIVSGDRGANQVDEARAMADYLWARGVPRQALVVDSQGVNTWRTARFTADYLKERGLDSVIVVSQHFHIPRSVWALKKAGCPKVGQAAPDYWESLDIYSTLREIPANIYYRWQY